MAGVFLGQRKGYSDHTAWQMPQGGIEPGESPIEAAFREMYEEIGTQKAQLLAEHPEWLIYDIPPDSRPSFWKERYCGQRQKWFALRFLGTDSDIQLETSASPEFSAWRWEKISNLALRVVEFKRELYQRLMSDFESFSDPGHPHR